MSRIKVPESIKEKLLARVEAVIAATAEEYSEALERELVMAPYPAIPNLDRAKWLLRREVEKALHHKSLRQDGGRAKLKAAAVGQVCPKSGIVMQTLAEIELDHEEYDGRAPLAVHKGWHKKAQPH